MVFGFRCWLFIFVGLAWGALVFASESAQQEVKFPLSGRLFTDFYVPTRQPKEDPYRQISGSAWLQLSPTFGKKTSAMVILTGDALESTTSETGVSSGPTSSSQLRMGLREGFASYFDQGFEVRMGKQIIPWGVSDGIQPNDFLTAKDYTFLNPDDEVRRKGSVAALFSWTPRKGSSPLHFDFAWIPVFAQHTLLIPKQAAVSATGLTLNTTPQVPTRNLKNSEFALKSTYAGSGWDVSAVFFKGWNHYAEYVPSVNGAFPNLTATVQPFFHRQKAIGLMGSISQEAWVFRGEGAYVWTENNSGNHALIEPSHMDWVIGAEHPFWDHFRLQVQGVWRYFPRWFDPKAMTAADPITAAVYQQVARANALLLAYSAKHRPGGTLRLSYNHEDRGIEAEVLAVGYFLAGDFLIRPKVGYALSDALNMTLGLDFYGGPEDEPLGSLKGYRAVFFETKYVF